MHPPYTKLKSKVAAKRNAAIILDQSSIFYTTPSGITSPFACNKTTSGQQILNRICIFLPNYPKSDRRRRELRGDGRAVALVLAVHIRERAPCQHVVFEHAVESEEDGHPSGDGEVGVGLPLCLGGNVLLHADAVPK